MKYSCMLMIVAVTATSTQAAISNWQSGWNDDSAIEQYEWEFVQPNWQVSEWYIGDEPDETQLWASGELAAGPDSSIITISKEVTNNTTFAWTGYELDITGINANYVANSISVTGFANTNENGSKLTFDGSTVGIGQSVVFEFDIAIGTGAFDFDVSQLPIPEPATALAGMVAGTLLLRRRK